MADAMSVFKNHGEQVQPCVDALTALIKDVSALDDVAVPGRDEVLEHLDAALAALTRTDEVDESFLRRLTREEGVPLVENRRARGGSDHFLARLTSAGEAEAETARLNEKRESYRPAGRAGRDLTESRRRDAEFYRRLTSAEGASDDAFDLLERHGVRNPSVALVEAVSRMDDRQSKVAFAEGVARSRRKRR